MAEKREFNETPSFTKLDDGMFRVEKDTHALSDIKPLEQMQLMANQMQQILSNCLNDFTSKESASTSIKDCWMV